MNKLISIRQSIDMNFTSCMKPYIIEGLSKEG